MTMKTRDVYVDASPIHGRGLFAARAIESGEVIGRIDGVPATRDGRYVLWLTDTLGIRVRGPFRYINHSHQPNAVYYDTREVVALRAIRPGEEITHNYDQP